MKKIRREILNALMGNLDLDMNRGYSQSEALDNMKEYFSKNDDYKNESLYVDYGDLYIQIVEEFLAVASFLVKK